MPYKDPARQAVATRASHATPAAMERDRARKRENYKRTPEQHRRWALKRRYNITPEQYDAMLAAQGGHCAMCPATNPGKRIRFFHVDHDHKTGEVRGLLCSTCNTFLGIYEKVKDRAEAYLFVYTPSDPA